MAYIKLIVHLCFSMLGGFCAQQQQQNFFSGQKLLQEALRQAKEKVEKVPKDMRPESMRGSLKARK